MLARQPTTSRLATKLAPPAQSSAREASAPSLLASGGGLRSPAAGDALAPLLARAVEQRTSVAGDADGVVRHGRSTGPRLLQRTISERKAQTMLETVLRDHDSDWYGKNWASGTTRRLAKEVADRADTTENNVRSRFQGHPTLEPILRAHRMKLEFGAAAAFDDAGLQEVYDAYRRLLFFHVSKAASAIRSSGLDPSFGGTAGGISDERSLAEKRAHNVAQSKGKAFVTRKFSEASQYMADGADIVQLLIPAEQQARLKVDPDSMFGLYYQNHDDFRATIKGVDRHSRDLSWWAYAYLAKEVGAEAQHRLPELVAELRRRGAFFPARAEDEVNLADFGPVPTMSEEDAMAKARLVHGSG